MIGKNGLSQGSSTPGQYVEDYEVSGWFAKPYAKMKRLVLILLLHYMPSFLKLTRIVWAIKFWTWVSHMYGQNSDDPKLGVTCHCGRRLLSTSGQLKVYFNGRPVSMSSSRFHQGHGGTKVGRIQASLNSLAVRVAEVCQTFGSLIISILKTSVCRGYLRKHGVEERVSLTFGLKDDGVSDVFRICSGCRPAPSSFAHRIETTTPLALCVERTLASFVSVHPVDTLQSCGQATSDI